MRASGSAASCIYEKRETPKQWKKPEKVKYRPVDRPTGLLLIGSCFTEEPSYELFITGFEPRAFCPGDPYPGKPFFITHDILGGLMLYEPEEIKEPTVEDATEYIEALH